MHNIYLCTLYKSDLIELNLICSKPRVAPIKAITIPHLELLGNLLLSRLMDSVKLALKEELKFKKLTDKKEWFYVHTLNNPADMIKKQNFKNIAKENVWWHGSSFLIKETKFNEKVMQPEILLESDIEIQNQINVCLTFRTADKINLTGVINIKKFSLLLKLKRIIAFMGRLMNN